MNIAHSKYEYPRHGEKSCAYDALRAAGLPAPHYAKSGIDTATLLEMLRDQGCQVHLKEKGNKTVSPKNPFFIVFQDGDLGHIEYYRNADDLPENGYPPKIVVAVVETEPHP
jgi:hypothetical protein